MGRHRVASPSRSQESRIAAVLAVMLAVGLAASGGLVWRRTEAAFTATTLNSANNWTAGKVTLTDDDSGGAMFSAFNLSAGISDTRCIVVTYNGDVTAAAVRLYATAYSDTGGLASHVTLTVHEGSGGTYAGGCASPTGTQGYSNTLADFGTTRTNYGTGVGSWNSVTPAASRVYRISYVVGASAPASASTTVTFTWEARS